MTEWGEGRKQVITWHPQLPLPSRPSKSLWLPWGSKKSLKNKLLPLICPDSSREQFKRENEKSRLLFLNLPEFLLPQANLISTGSVLGPRPGPSRQQASSRPQGILTLVASLFTPQDHGAWCAIHRC